jgi:hypothetical protein
VTTQAIDRSSTTQHAASVASDVRTHRYADDDITREHGAPLACAPCRRQLAAGARTPPTSRTADATRSGRSQRAAYVRSIHVCATHTRTRTLTSCWLANCVTRQAPVRTRAITHSARISHRLASFNSGSSPSACMRSSSAIHARQSLR